MIRINLIYDRKAIEIRKIKGELALCGLLVVLVAGGVFMAMVKVNGTIEDLTAKKAMVNAQKQSLDKVAKEIKKFETSRQGLQEVITAVTSLQNLQKGPSRIFDELNQKLSDEVWLTSIAESSGNIKIEGFSYTNPGIASFMNNLKEGKYFTSVQLVGINKNTIAGEDVKKFSLNVTVADKI